MNKREINLIQHQLSKELIEILEKISSLNFWGITDNEKKNDFFNFIDKLKELKDEFIKYQVMALTAIE